MLPQQDCNVGATAAPPVRDAVRATVEPRRVARPAAPTLALQVAPRPDSKPS